MNPMPQCKLTSLFGYRMTTGCTGTAGMNAPVEVNGAKRTKIMSTHEAKSTVWLSTVEGQEGEERG